MKYIVVFALLLFYCVSGDVFSEGRVPVRGYYRRDGTYVRPHTRSRPSSSGNSSSGGYSSSRHRSVPVRGHYRRDGTYVKPHMRSLRSSEDGYDDPNESTSYGTGYGGSSFRYRHKQYDYHLRELKEDEIQVVSGFSFKYQGERYRLSRIDSSKRKRGQQKEAKERLKNLLNSGTVKIREITKDGGGTIIAQVFVDGEDVSQKLIDESLLSPKY